VGTLFITKNTTAIKLPVSLFVKDANQPLQTMAAPAQRYDEPALIARLREQQTREAAFSDLVRSFQQMLYYHIRRMVGDHDDADDVLQNAFIKAWRYIDKFRGDSSLKTWLYRIATNEAITHINQKKRLATLDINDLTGADIAQNSTQSNPTDTESIEKKLQTAIQTLPDKQRAVFLLRYYDEMPYHEMSTVLETSEGALKASYHHAVKKIEAILVMGYEL
jgi:RNA polymerase sigma factor (sigma-70 family)